MTTQQTIKRKKASRPRILVVEDILVAQRAIRDMLEQLGCVVDLAKNGQLALRMIEKPYDFILLDIGLPDMSGAHLCEIIRYRFRDIKTPIVAYTTLNNINELIGTRAYFNDFMMKPASLEEFNHVLSKWMPRYKKMKHKLTRQETNCLNLAARGLTVEETARALNIQSNTVKQHRKGAIKKLRCHSLAHAIFKSILCGYIEPLQRHYSPNTTENSKDRNNLSHITQINSC